MCNILKVSRNRSGTSSSFWINRRWVFHLRICLAVEKKFGPNVVLHCWRPCDLEYLGFLFFLNLKYLCLLDDCLWGIVKEKIWELPVFEIWRNISVFMGILFHIFGKFPDMSYQPRPCRMQNLSKVMFFFKKHKMLIWSQFVGKCGIFQLG